MQSCSYGETGVFLLSVPLSFWAQMSVLWIASSLLTDKTAREKQEVSRCNNESGVAWCNIFLPGVSCFLFPKEIPAFVDMACELSALIESHEPVWLKRMPSCLWLTFLMIFRDKDSICEHLQGELSICFIYRIFHHFTRLTHLHSVCTIPLSHCNLFPFYVWDCDTLIFLQWLFPVLKLTDMQKLYMKKGYYPEIVWRSNTSFLSP